jgi:hypothetical protein
MPEYTRKKTGALTPYEEKLMAAGPSRNITTNNDDNKKDFPTDRLPRGQKFAEEQASLDKQRKFIRSQINSDAQYKQDRKYKDESNKALDRSVDEVLERTDDQQAFKKGGAVKMAKGGSVKSSASKRADGIAQRGKTRGKMC